jgi:hypothetical protein
MDKTIIDEQERIILLRRFHEKRDAMLVASKEIEDLRVEYITSGKKDSNGKIESEVVKRLLTIFSCLSELGISRPVLEMLENIYYLKMRYNRIHVGLKPDEELHVSEAVSTSQLCALANLLEIRWVLKKGPYVSIKIEKLESIFKAQLTPG